MPSYIIKQGEDKKIVIPVKDSAGADVNVSTATEIRAVVFVGGQKQESYSFSDPTLGRLTKTGGGTPNEINVYVDREHTRLWPVGTLNIAVVVSIPDEDFPDSTADSEYDFLVGRVVGGLGKDESL